MAREIIEKGVCDWCGKDAVETFTLTNSSVTAVLDVCAYHAAPLTEAIGMGSQAPRAGKRQVDRPAQHQVRGVD